MHSFRAKIEIIGINPYVLLPAKVLDALCAQAGKTKSPIPVKGTINDFEFIQTLVKYSGLWRLYLNTPMRVGTNTSVGDLVNIQIEFDPADRSVPMHQKLKKALEKDKAAKKIFDSLQPSLQKELLRYIHQLKSEESIDRNIEKTILFLHGKQRHIGRDKP